MPLVDDAAQVRARLGALGERLLAGGVELLDELVHRLALHQHVVLGEADLAGAEGLAPEQPLCGQLQVRVAGDEGRVAAAELEGDGRQVLGGPLADDAGDVGAARVEDLVPLLVEQGGGLRDGAVDDAVGLRVQAALHDGLDDHGDVGGALGGLEHSGAPGGDGADQGHDGEHEGEVVGADDQGAAQGLLVDADLVGLEDEGDIRILVLGELVDVVEHVHAVVGGPVDLGEPGLVRGLAQVAHQGLLQLGAMVLDAPVQLAELHLAVLQVLGLEGAETGTHSGAGPGDAVDSSGGEGWDVNLGALVDARCASHGEYMCTRQRYEKVLLYECEGNSCGRWVLEQKKKRGRKERLKCNRARATLQSG